MLSASSKKKSLQIAMAECSCQQETLRRFAAEIAAGLSEISATGDANLADIFF